jgi:hypothetical protein
MADADCGCGFAALRRERLTTTGETISGNLRNQRMKMSFVMIVCGEEDYGASNRSVVQ